MERTANPWQWSLAFGFNQAELVQGASRSCLCRPKRRSMQTGLLTRRRHGRADVVALDNVEGGAARGRPGSATSCGSNFYTTDVDAFLANERVLGLASVPSA